MKNRYLCVSPLVFEKDCNFFANDRVGINPLVVWVLLRLAVLILCPEGFVILDVPGVRILSSLSFCHLFL